MKVIILAGGMQSTLNSDREGIPKPMIDIGGKPLLWHIMRYFSSYGLNEFIICGGYRVDMIKEYFMDYYIYASDITVDLQTNKVVIHKKKTENWTVTVVDTGLSSSTGQRIGLVQGYIGESDFFVTYGDCLFDIDINALMQVHQENGKTATIAMAKPTGRNELLPIDLNGQIHYVLEDSAMYENAWVNANCFVFNKNIFTYLHEKFNLDKNLFFELSKEQQLKTYKHRGFWMPIETKRDLSYINNLWNTGTAPWKKEEDVKG